MRPRSAPTLVLAALALPAGPLARPAAAQTPTGLPVPELAVFDQIMQSHMQANGITCGVLGVIRNSEIVYQRGFGCPENTPMRLASVEKPLTAAAIHVLASWGALDLDENVFDLGQFGGGILPHQPYNGTLADNFLTIVTVQDLLDHMGGWDPALSLYPMFSSVLIAGELGVPSPPSRDQIVEYMLAQPLQWVPGTTYAYSNFGYMLLGLIVEQLSGMNHWDFITTFVITPAMWSPATEVFRGRTFQSSQSPREPSYDHPTTCQNVFDPGGSAVSCPYGGWSHENFLGHGNLVAGAAPILRFLDVYTVVGGSIGLPHNGNTQDIWHNGAVDGTSTTARQTDDGFHVVVLYNKRGSGPHLAEQVTGQIVAAAQGITSWPDGREVDGFWVDFGLNPLGYGGYDDPFPSFATALPATTDGTKLRLHPGSTGWTGVIDEQTLIDAPLGTCVIGE